MVEIYRSATNSHEPNSYPRNLVEIYPGDYSSSYRRLILKDFTDTDGMAAFTIRNATKDLEKTHGGVFDVLTRVNIARDSMGDDEDFVMPVNFSALGCILLEFTNGLSKHMVSSNYTVLVHRSDMELAAYFV